MVKTTFFHISTKGKMSVIEKLDDALQKINSEGYVWLSLVNPDPNELFIIQDRLNLSPISIQDCLDDNQIPKINEFPKHTFLIFDSYHYSNNELGIGELNLFLGNKFLVSVSQMELTYGHPFFDIEALISLNMGNIKNGPDFLMHILIDKIVDHKVIAIEAIEDNLIQIEETINADDSQFQPSDLQKLRRQILALRKSLFLEREVLIKISSNDTPFISSGALFDYRNIYDHIVRLFEHIEMDRELVTSLMQINLSIINNRITESANKTNTFIRRLTLITTIFMPLTLITGIGGMSEFTMITGIENWKFVYPALLVAMILIGLVNYFLLKRLEKDDRGTKGKRK